MACDFCKYLSDQEAAARRREADSDILHHDFHVLLFERAWNDLTGTTHAGEMTHKPKAVGFDINYCPECGRKIRKE